MEANPGASAAPQRGTPARFAAAAVPARSILLEIGLALLLVAIFAIGERIRRSAYGSRPR